MSGSQPGEVGSIPIRAIDSAEWCNGRHAMLKPSCLFGVRVRPSPRLLVGQAVPDGDASSDMSYASGTARPTVIANESIADGQVSGWVS